MTIPSSASRGWLPLTCLVAAALLASLAAVGGAGAQSAPVPARIIETDRAMPIPGGTVYLHYLLADDGSGDEPVPIDLPGEPIPDGVSAAFHVNQWSWPATSIPVVVQVNPTLESPRPPLVAAVQNAVQQWSSVTPSTFAFTLGPNTNAAPGLCLGNPTKDGINSVQYTNSLPSRVLGITCTDVPDNSHVLDEFDLELNYKFDWGGGSTIGSTQYDVWSTTLHEMGHAAGLSHSCESATKDCSAEGQAAVMYYALGQGIMKRTLTADDKAGLIALYPSDVQTIPPFEHNFAVTAVGLVRN